MTTKKPKLAVAASSTPVQVLFDLRRQTGEKLDKLREHTDVNVQIEVEREILSRLDLNTFGALRDVRDITKILELLESLDDKRTADEWEEVFEGLFDEDGKPKPYNDLAEAARDLLKELREADGESNRYVEDAMMKLATMLDGE